MGNTQRKESQEKFIKQNPFLIYTWEEFLTHFTLDEEYGASFCSKAFILENPIVQQLHSYCLSIPLMIAEGNIIECEQQLNLENLSPSGDRKYDIYVFGLMLYVLNSWVFSQSPVPQVLHQKLAVPVYKFSKALGVKPSLGFVQCFGNWRRKQEDKCLYELDNLYCDVTFTGRIDEEVFFLLSNIADFRFAKIFEQVYISNSRLAEMYLSLDNSCQSFISQLLLSKGMIQTTCLQQQLIKKQQLYGSNIRFENMRQDQWKCHANHGSELVKIYYHLKFNSQLNDTEELNSIVNICFIEMKEQISQITKSLKKMFEFNDPVFFFNVLRKYLQGYSNKETFPNGLKFEGIDLSFFSEGGSGGNSPSFQIFERSIGIVFEGDIEQIQQGMREGMITEHRELIKLTKSYSLLRIYALLGSNAQVKNNYNSVIEAYIEFNEKHLYYIGYYIEQQLISQGVDPISAKGTGNIPLQVIKNKYRMFRKYLIELDD